jgi:DnaJ-class molecular chaperone
VSDTASAGKDLYAILGVAKGSSDDEIRKAYRKLARKHHPDVNPGDKGAEERFKDVSVAYDVLGDAAKRKLYDEFGHEGLQPGFDPARAREYRRWAESGQGFSFRGGEFGFGGGGRGRRRRAAAEEGPSFADLFGEMFGGGVEEEAETAPLDLEQALEVDFLDALRGTSLDVSVRRPVPCGQCGGTGRVSRRACTSCGGTGRIEQREKLVVKIPAGVGDGSRVRVPGKGAVSPRTNKAGNLVFVVRVRPHPLLERHGRDLTMEVPITVPEAVNGATIDVPTPTGRVRLRVQPNSQSGQRLRLRGRGAPDPKGGTAGDLYVRLMVVVPPAGEADVTAALTTLGKAYREDPRAHIRL